MKRRAYIDCSSYMNIIEQAAKNDGRAIIESKGSAPLEIMIDVEYAKKEWEEFEKMLKKFNDRKIKEIGEVADKMVTDAILG